MAEQSKSKMSKKAKDFISAKIKTLMHDFYKTGKIGNSKPSSRSAAQRQAIAVAFSMAKREGYKVTKGAEDYHNEVFALAEVIFMQLNICYERGRHRFPNPQLPQGGTQLFDRIENTSFVLSGVTFLEGDNLRNLFEEPCLDCGARWDDDAAGHISWDNPAINLEIEEGFDLSDLMEMGPHHICGHCGQRVFQNPRDNQAWYYNDGDDEVNGYLKHGQGICIPDEEVDCPICGEHSRIGDYFDYRDIDIWMAMHGEGICIEEELKCEYCKQTFRVAGPQRKQLFPPLHFHQNRG